MISEIHINAPVATYQRATRLSDLRRINFIFGTNGTGKTTISRVIAQAEGHKHCSLTWKGGDDLKCMVYNRDFVEQNFNQDGPLQGVFTLGENQVEAEREIAGLQPEIEKTNGLISSLNNQLNGEDGQSGKYKKLADLDPELTRKCWKKKQLHDEHFQEAFAGVRNSAERFKDKILAEHASNTAELCSLDELKVRAETVFSNNINRAAQLGQISADALITIEGDSLLQKVIVGNQDIDIAPLIERLGNSDWVKQGRHYHEQQSDICPFCQQPTGKEFAANLAKFFSEAFDNDIESLKQLQSSYQNATEKLLVAIQNSLVTNNPFLKGELFNAEVQVLTEKLKNNQAKLDKKIDEPSKKIELESIEPLVSQLNSLITSANEEAKEHNQTVDNITTEKQNLTAQVWRYVLNELADDLQQYEQQKSTLMQAISGMNQSLDNKNNNLRKLQGQIKELEKQTTSIQPTITAINDLLQKFGFNSFTIGEADDGRHYKIIRSNGDDASRSLSEGERTFITFLYFYYLIKGAQSPTGITMNRVVVFDDPISSLDSDILYIVSSLIRGYMDSPGCQQQRQVMQGLGLPLYIRSVNWHSCHDPDDTTRLRFLIR